jgi:hypothetical protein
MATLVTPTDKTEKVEKKNPPVTDDKTERKQRPRVDEKFKIFSGTANEPLADEVCQFLAMPRGQAMLKRFADGEVYVQIQENVRGCDVFVIQPTCRPVDAPRPGALRRWFHTLDIRGKIAKTSRALRFRRSWWPIY